MTKTVLLSILPEYVEKIFAQTKTVELRRRFPSDVDEVLIYAASPVKAIVGKLIVRQILEHHPRTLWPKVKGMAGVDYKIFEAYYSGASQGYAIFIEESVRFRKTIPLSILRKQWSGFHPPQGYHYLSEQQVNWIYKLTT